MLLSAIQQRYLFLKTPNLEQVLSERTGAFEHGTFNSQEVKRLIFGESFFACDIHGSTDLSDEMADDLENWAISELGYVRKEDGIAAKGYGSELEISFSSEFAGRFKELVGFGSRIAQQIRDYGNETVDYGLDRIGFLPDPGGNQLLKTIPFAIERRAGVPHSFNLWYSSAPLKTADHIKFLEEFAGLAS